MKKVPISEFFRSRMSLKDRVAKAAHDISTAANRSFCKRFGHKPRQWVEVPESTRKFASEIGIEDDHTHITFCRRCGVQMRKKI